MYFASSYAILVDLKWLKLWLWTLWVLELFFFSIGMLYISFELCNKIKTFIYNRVLIKDFMYTSARKNIISGNETFCSQEIAEIVYG